MQVQNYPAQAIPYQHGPITEKLESIQVTQSQTNQSIQQFLNRTFQVLNQTIQHTVGKVNDSKSLDHSSPISSFQDEWNILYFLRLFFYVLVIIKIMDLIFSKRKKIDVKERVYRKYVFSHSEMIREFDDEDRKMMETTLKNTIKNANLQKVHPKIVRKTSNKKVVIQQHKNQYILPKKSTQNDQGLSALQAYLSRLAERQAENKSSEEGPQDKQFQILETISQLVETKNHSTVLSETQTKDVEPNPTDQQACENKTNDLTEQEQRVDQKDIQIAQMKEQQAEVIENKQEKENLAQQEKET